MPARSLPKDSPITCLRSQSQPVVLCRPTHLPVSWDSANSISTAATQRVYSEGGQVANPSTGAPSGVFQSSGPMVPDATTNTAYFATQQSGPTVIKSFDLTHFTPVSSITVPGVSGTVERLLRWGNNGLAFNTTGGQIVLMGGNLPVAAPFPPATPIPRPRLRPLQRRKRRPSHL